MSPTVAKRLAAIEGQVELLVKLVIELLNQKVLDLYEEARQPVLDLHLDLHEELKGEAQCRKLRKKSGPKRTRSNAASRRRK